MKHAYSFRRMSKGIQREGTSENRQNELRDAYLERKKLQLDSSFVLPVAELSAFRGRQRRTGALKLFLDAVEKRRIKKGSYLIIENLDRLSREQVEEAFDLFMRIIRAGIVLVTLVPEMEYTAGSLTLPSMILALAEFTRAHGESLIKQERSKGHWRNQRKRGREGRLSYVLPGWIRRLKAHKKEKGRLVLDPERAKIVRQIFAWCNKGLGGQVIARKLNEAGIPCFGRGKSQGERWHKSYLSIMLRNRACIGEFQPHVLDDNGVRVSFGKPIPDYYPVVVTPETFARAQQALKARYHKRGGINRHCTNLFARMVREEVGNAFHVQHGNHHAYLVNTAMIEGTADRQSSIPYYPFERCVLEWIAELQLETESDDPLPGLRAQEDDLVQRLATMKAKMRKNKQLEDLMDLYADMKIELEEVQEQIQEAMTPRQGVLEDVKLAIDYLGENPKDETKRRELRLHLSLLLREIVVRVSGKFRSRRKVYYLTIRFVDGTERKVWFETPVYASGPWDEGMDFPASTMEIRSELIRRGRGASASR